MKDFLGKTIKVGDTIVYPVRRGSSMSLRKGVVKKLNPTFLIEVDIERWKRDPSTDEYDVIKGRKIVPFYSEERCVIVERKLLEVGIEGLLNDMDA